MNRNRKADARWNGIGSKTNFTGREIKAFSTSNYRARQPISLCRDYMKFALNGYCLDCMQAMEYVTRERPETSAEIGKRGTI